MSAADILATAPADPSPGLQAWLDWIAAGHDPRRLSDLLAEDAEFRSPVVFTPKYGPEALAYLIGGTTILGNDKFRYLAMFDDPQQRKAALVFESELDGVYAEGLDLIEWNEDGKIARFTVMLRPAKALEAAKAAMAAFVG
jgi:hypothetical protein